MSSTEVQHFDPSGEQLCQQCNQLNINQFLAPQRLRLFYKLPQEISFTEPISSSSRSSCALCRILVQAIRSSPMNPINKVRFDSFGTTQTLEGYVTEAFCMSVPTKNSLRVAALGLDSYRLGSRRHTYARIVQKDRVNRDLIKAWLQQCESKHQRCSKPLIKQTNTTKAPQYVLDVEEMRVKEVNGQKIRYLALSYVWGQVQTLQLLTHNLKELMMPKSLEIHIEELPSVIQDAIFFTQDIQERYLWVDSLCICQDDVVNKHTQIAAMNLVYANAVMTLVAVNGDASYGLPGVKAYAKPRHQPVERVHGIRVTTIMPELHDIEVKSAWKHRAWTYQEQLFSRRLLFFTDNQVYFRCQVSAHCEDRYEGGDDSSYVLPESLLIHPNGRLGSNQAYVTWKRLVQNFSMREFTFDIDRYNAFAGIENELATQWKFPCSVGMPVSQLTQQLYWTHNLDQKGSIRRISQYASWSWCGWTGGVTFPPVHAICTEISEVQLVDEAALDAIHADNQSEPPKSELADVQTQRNYAIRGAIKPMLTFSTLSCSIPLDTSQLATNGILHIRTQSGTTCGIIYGRQLDISELHQPGTTIECLMVGSCSIGTSSSHMDEIIDSEFRNWFWPLAEEDSTNVMRISDTSQVDVFNKPLRRNTALERELTVSKPGLGWEIKWWMTHNGLGCVYYVCKYVLGAAGVLIATAPVAAVIVLLLTSYMAFVVLSIGVLGFFALVQIIFNWTVCRERRWFFWDSLISTTLGASLGSQILEWLPFGLDHLITRFFTRKGQFTGKERTKSIKIINIMLVSRRSEHGREVCKRLAIGMMTATSWSDFKPLRRQIILQ